MMKGLTNKKKVLELILITVTFFYALGLNVNLVSEPYQSKYSPVATIIFLILSCFYLLLGTVAIYQNRKVFFFESDGLLQQFFWCGWFLVLILLLNYHKPSQVILSLYYLLFVISFAFFNFWIALFYLAVVILIQYLLFYNLPWQGELGLFVGFAVISILFSLFGHVLKRERIKRYKLKSKLRDIEEGAKAFLDDEDKALIALREEKRIEKLYTTYNFLQEKVIKILHELKDLIEPHTVAFLKFREDGHHYVIFEAISESECLRYNEHIKLEDGIISWIYKHKKSLALSSVRGNSRAFNYYDRELAIKSFLGMPVFWKERIVGVVILDSFQENAFSKECEKIVKISITEIEDAMNNAQLFQQIQQQNQEFSALYRASKKLLSYVGLEENLNGFLNIVYEFLRFEIALLCLLEEDELKIKVAHGLKEDIRGMVVAPNTLLYWVIRHRQYLDIKNYREKKRINPLVGDGVKIPPLDRVLIYPFLIENKVVGAFMLGFVNKNISEYEKNVLEILTNQMSIAISNALLFEKVNLMATTDGLTGVFNHRYFQEKLTDEIERALRYGEKFVLMLLDIDHFKKVNDTYGHPVGDLVLKSVSKILKSTTRKVDIVARYGGEEFAIIMVQTDKQGAIKFAERLRKAIEESEVITQGGKLKVTVSIGLSSFPDDAKDKSLLIERADKALYKAKKGGRNRVVPYDSSLETENSIS